MNRYEAAAVAVRTELVLALRAARADFEALPGPTTGRPISGMSLDLHIQHGYVAVSLRTDEERWEQTHIGDWQHAQFLSSLQDSPDTAMSRLAAVVVELYTEVREDDVFGLADRRHMLYLVAAEAVLNEEVAIVLNELGIEAPVFGEELGSAPFAFFVYDADEMLTVNYCDVVRAHWVTARVLRNEAKRLPAASRTHG